MSHPVAVIDVGTSVTKAGFSGEESPRCLFHTCVGTPKHQKTRATLLLHPTEIPTGEEAYQASGLMSTAKPVVKGQIEDFDALEQLLFDTFYRRLCILPDSSPVLMLEAPDKSPKASEKTAEILFENFNVPMAGFLNTSSATVYSTGRTTGVAVDSGAGKTWINVVKEGFPVAGTLRTSYIAGDVLTDELFHSLRERGYPLSTEKDWRTVENVKETICRAAMNLPAEQQAMREEGPRVSFELPDNERIFVFEELFMIPERLFDPSTMSKRHWRSVDGGEPQLDLNQWRPTSPTGMSEVNPRCKSSLKGWAETIDEVISYSPELIRDTLYENVVLGGGTSMLADLEKRLQRLLVANNATRKNVMGEPRLVKCVAFEERAVAGWLGGSIWSASPSFLYSTLSKTDYDEIGPNSVHTYRC